MNKEVVGRRVGLDIEATELLEKSVKELKEGKAYIKVNESKLASKVIRLYFTKHHKKEKTALEKEFFDQKSYLQEIIKKSNNNEELLSSMSSYLSKSKKRGRIENKEFN